MQPNTSKKKIGLKVTEIRGFTLIELIVIITILATLSALLLPKILVQISEANRTKEISNARVLAEEISVYNATESHKPEDWIVGDPINDTTDLSAIGGLPVGVELPDESIVTIHVNDDGMASIQVVP